MRELFIDAFQPFISDIKKYGLHSLRPGGATTAANYAISDRLQRRIHLKRFIKRQVNWFQNI
jgi:hypothetical protein